VTNSSLNNFIGILVFECLDAFNVAIFDGRCTGFADRATHFEMIL
jgi:hypothetical protein